VQNVINESETDARKFSGNIVTTIRNIKMIPHYITLKTTIFQTFQESEKTVSFFRCCVFKKTQIAIFKEYIATVLFLFLIDSFANCSMLMRCFAWIFSIFSTYGKFALFWFACKIPIYYKIYVF